MKLIPTSFPEHSGEDPNAKFLAMVAQREAGSTAGWWRRLFRRGEKRVGKGQGEGEGERGEGEGGSGSGVEGGWESAVGGGNDGGKGDGVLR